MLWAYITLSTSKVTMAINHTPWYKIRLYHCKNIIYYLYTSLLGGVSYIQVSQPFCWDLIGGGVFVQRVKDLVFILSLLWNIPPKWNVNHFVDIVASIPWSIIIDIKCEVEYERLKKMGCYGVNVNTNLKSMQLISELF